MVRPVPDKDRVLVGVIGAAHGIKGAIRVKSFTHDPKAIADYSLIRGDKDGGGLKLSLIRPDKGGFIAAVDGIADRNAAEGLKGLKLYVMRRDLPKPSEEEFYHHDLIGLKVLDDQGQERGTVKAVENFGAGELLELALEEPVKDMGRDILVPFTRALVPEIDPDRGFVTVLIEDWASNQIETGEKKG